MPNIVGNPYFELAGPKLRDSNLSINFAFGAGTEEKKSKKVGGVIGMGVGFKGNRVANQIWRMDYHDMHPNGQDLAQWSSWPFHYHVIRPQQHENH